MVFEKETKSLTDPLVIGDTIESSATGDDKEYLETIVLMDIPTSVPVDSGVVSVSFSDTGGDLLNPIYIEIFHAPALLAGTFTNWEGAATGNSQFHKLERANYKTVTFTGTVPYAVEVDMTHSASRLYVVNPRGDIKNLTWKSGVGTLKVIITPAWMKTTAPAPGETLGDVKHFKFYVAGDDLSALAIAPSGARGFDINGNEITQGQLTATVQ
jgi:hypothetical protein